MSEDILALQKQLYQGYKQLSDTLTALRVHSLEQGDIQGARYYAAKETGAARLFEMGWYHELSPMLDVAAAEKDGELVLAILDGLLDCLPTIMQFTLSPLFNLMTFRTPDEDYFASMRADILESLKDPSYDYVRQCEGYEAFLEKWSNI